jgi:hypothetical protein
MILKLRAQNKPLLTEIKVFFGIFSAFLLLSCGKSSTISSGQTKTSDKALDAAAALAKSTVSITNLGSTEITETPVSKNLGPRTLLLSPQALSQTIAKCFGPNPRRGGPNADYFNTHSDKYFTVFEERALGKREVFNSGGIRSAGNTILGAKHYTKMKLKSELNQEYLHALRTFLGTGCRNLVDEEFSLLNTQQANSGAKNKLVQAEVPIGVHVSKFMSCLYGFSPSEGLHEGAEAYAKLFASNMNNAEAKKDRKTFLTKNYQQLCVALGSDPRFFTR